MHQQAGFMLVKRAKYDPLFTGIFSSFQETLLQLHVKPGIMVTIGKTVWVFCPDERVSLFFLEELRTIPTED